MMVSGDPVNRLACRSRGYITSSILALSSSQSSRRSGSLGSVVAAPSCAETQTLQVPRPLQWANVYSPQSSVARELCHRLLGPLVIPGDEHVERLARHLAFN